MYQNKAIINSIQKEIIDESDFLNLLSPKAFSYIEQIAQKAHEITVRNFGKNILLYIPHLCFNFLCK
jgi:2-iminoacetate synthase